jgi:hypothetical protein
VPQSVDKTYRAIGVKQAWSIKNYRYVCNVSHPSPRPLCLPFAPFPHLLSSVSSSLCIPRSCSSQQALASSPEKHRSRGRRERLPSDFIAAILSLLPCWLPRPSLNLTLYFPCPRSTGSRRHRRPRRSTWEQWRCVRSKLRPRSLLR